MSEHNNEVLWEKIQDDLGEHIENYFRDSGTEDSDRELLDFIWSDAVVWGALKTWIANSKLGARIAQRVFDNLPDGQEEDTNEDY